MQRLGFCKSFAQTRIVTYNLPQQPKDGLCLSRHDTCICDGLHVTCSMGKKGSKQAKEPNDQPQCLAILAWQTSHVLLHV